MKLKITIVSSILLLAINSCKDSSTESLFSNYGSMEVAITRNTNTHEEIVMNVLTSFAIYDSISDVSHIYFGNRSGKSPYEISVYFPGKYGGAYEWYGEKTSVTIMMNSYTNPNQKEEWHSTIYGNTMFAGFNKINEPIKGAFYGKFVRNNVTDIDTLYISGIFESTRLK